MVAKFLNIAVLLAFLCAAVCAANAQQFVITEITDDDLSFAVSLNDHRQIAGAEYLWDNGDLLHLGGLGSTGAYGEAINNSGQVAGWSELSPGIIAPFFWEDGVIVPLPSLHPFGFGWAFDIDEAGQVVGYSYRPNSTTPRATLWPNPETVIDIAAQANIESGTIAMAINEIGHIAIVAGDSVIIWNGTSAIPVLGPLMDDLVITDMNDHDTVVGFIDQEAFYLEGTTLHPLPPFPGDNFSQAQAINNAGEIVGWSVGPKTSGRAFWFDGEEIHDLNLILSDQLPPGVTLCAGQDINENGDILTIANQGRFYLLQRVPTIPFQIEEISVVRPKGEEPVSIVVQWTSESGKFYAIDRANDPGGPWVELESNLPAAAEGNSTQFSDSSLPSPLPERSYYRVRGL